MGALIRVVNAFFAALFLVGALGCFGLLVAASERSAREPEDVWLASGWATLMLAFASLCFVNLRSVGRDRRSPLLAANMIALLVTAAFLFVPDPALRLIGGIALIPFAATALAMLAARSSAE